jgi:hypothetical protein
VERESRRDEAMLELGQAECAFQTTGSAMCKYNIINKELKCIVKTK